MQKREGPLVALESVRWSEISTETRIDVETSDEGLRLLSAFMRIHDPALRAAAIDFVSGLAKRSEQA
jgi:hypothetical protein